MVMNLWMWPQPTMSSRNLCQEPTSRDVSVPGNNRKQLFPQQGGMGSLFAGTSIASNCTINVNFNAGQYNESNAPCHTSDPVFGQCMKYLLTEPRTFDRPWFWLTDWYRSVNKMDIREKQFHELSNEIGKCIYFQPHIVCALTEHKILSNQCKKCHYGDNTIVKSCYAHNGICFILTRCHLYIESGLKCKWIPLVWLMLTWRNCTAKKSECIIVGLFFSAFMMKWWYDILDWTSLSSFWRGICARKSRGHGVLIIIRDR